MNKRKDHFSVAEQTLLDGTKKVANEVAKTMPQNASVIDDSIKTIESGASQGQVRTLTRDNPFSTSSNSFSTPQAADVSNGAKAFNDSGNQDSQLWKSGTTDTLILFATVALVLLVFIVSYTVFNFWN